MSGAQKWRPPWGEDQGIFPEVCKQVTQFTYISCYTQISREKFSKDAVIDIWPKKEKMSLVHMQNPARKSHEPLPPSLSSHLLMSPLPWLPKKVENRKLLEKRPVIEKGTEDKLDI